MSTQGQFRSVAMQPFAYALLLLVFAAATGHFAGRYARQVKGHREAIEALESCLGKELKKLESEQLERLVGHLSNLGVDCQYNGVKGFGPWYVWDFRKKGHQSRFLLLEADKTIAHLGSTRINLTVLDDSGKVVSDTALSTGWRCYLRDATLETTIEGEYPLVVLDTGLGGGPGPDVLKQYYAWMGNHFDLIRLEDSEGNATRNRYYLEHFKCGPYRTERTESQWIADIASADRLRVLRALSWLGGTHWDLQRGGEDGRYVEEVDQVHLVWRVRANPMVIPLVREMSTSDDQWLRQAAFLAANPEDDHF